MYAIIIRISTHIWYVYDPHNKISIQWINSRVFHQVYIMSFISLHYLWSSLHIADQCYNIIWSFTKHQQILHRQYSIINQYYDDWRSQYHPHWCLFISFLRSNLVINSLTPPSYWVELPKKLKVAWVAIYKMTVAKCSAHEVFGVGVGVSDKSTDFSWKLKVSRCKKIELYWTLSTVELRILGPHQSLGLSTLKDTL